MNQAITLVNRRTRGTRFYLLLVPLCMAACSGSDAPVEVPFTSMNARVVSIREECEIVFPAGSGQAEPQRGACPAIIVTARGQEFRSAAVRRKLAITYAYTSPADGQLYQGTSERDQSVSAPVPQRGDSIEIFAHPTEATVTRLDNGITGP